MKELKVTWKGETPLIMHSCKCVNPLHPLAKEIKKYTSKRNKTDDDYEIISNLEWFSGAYYTNDNIKSLNDPNIDGSEHKLYVPSENILATIINGAKAFKKGTDVKKYVDMITINPILEVAGNPAFGLMARDFMYRQVNQMVVSRARVTRTRPRFDSWVLRFVLRYDETKIDVETIINAIEYSGDYVGLCDSRPRYGKFATVVDIA